ncbi:aldose 1-epimerase [Ammoniphilus sp. YIM 78166]|uniref:aldose 1-epimerase n=1 Tax=Ammoniphilus sp. YIM 78166 TaxID=1644106 RepID=UPI00106F857F|nr:aldose 1-epimerase [Ammoniphilus sp. YIM 78166]
MGFVKEELFHGEKAITLSHGNYRATLLPDCGGNLISFVDTEAGYQFLREPQAEDMEDFKSNPFAYGIPVLFPPNRMEDGRFSFEGKVYRLPINEEARNNHLHGFFYAVPWQVVKTEASPQESFVMIAQQVTESHPAYAYFPHTFTLSMRFSLSDDGLRQDVQVINQGSSPMPCLLGFHTAINAPFATGSTLEDMEFTLTIGDRWEVNDRMLPTGKIQPMSEQEMRIKGEGVSPYFTRLDNHYSAEPVKGKNQMVLTDKRKNVRLVYDAGLQYKHWMIWNRDAVSGFFCPEPQTCMVNTPNLSLPIETTGMIVLGPEETWQETSRIYVEKA